MVHLTQSNTKIPTNPLITNRVLDLYPWILKAFLSFLCLLDDLYSYLALWHIYARWGLESIESRAAIHKSLESRDVNSCPMMMIIRHSCWIVVSPPWCSYVSHVTGHWYLAYIYLVFDNYGWLMMEEGHCGTVSHWWPAFLECFSPLTSKHLLLWSVDSLRSSSSRVKTINSS